MNSRIKWLTKEDKRILFLDFSGASIEESNQIWRDVEIEILNFQGNGLLPVLLDVTDVNYDLNTQAIYREIRNKTKNIPQKWAILGADTKTKVMIKIICIFIKDNIIFVNSLEEGKTVLTKNN